MAEQIKLQAKIVTPLRTVKIHESHRAVVSIFNPDYQEGSTEDKHKKWLPIYFTKWAGFKHLLQKGREVIFEGEYRFWKYGDIGTVFLAKSVKEITYEDIKPTQPQIEAPELEF